MANNPLKALGIIAGAAVGVASAAYGAQKVVVRTLSGQDVDFEFHAREQFVISSRDNARLVLYRDGPQKSTKPSIIFLHGYALCSPIWSHQFDDLRDEFDIISLDLRGHGASNIGDGGITMQTFADDICDVIDTLKLNNVIIVGHSTGGVVAMSYLDHHPKHASQHVVGLCLVSTLAHPPYHHVQNITEALVKSSFTGRAFYSLSDIPLIGYPMARFALGKKASHSVVEFVRRSVVATGREVCTRVLQVLADFNYLNTLQRFLEPSSVIVGTSDPITPLEDAARVARALGTSETVIDGVGHLPMLESPDEFNVALRDFLDKVTTL
jgi:pimeloyl-ACP methyl ester carboxylesterase